MRAMWTGTISFGMVSIPCKNYLAVDAPESRAHLLHVDCLGRVNSRTWCPTCEVTIGRSETTRGFEVAKDRYVTVSDEEFDSLPVPSLREVSLDRFVARSDAASVTRFARAAHYLEPEPLGRRAFALLRDAMESTDLIGIGKVSFRTREHLASIEPFKGALLLTTLAWPGEIRDAADLDIGDRIDIPARERELAEQLVRAMAGPFEPSAYVDDYQAALDALIESKVAGDSVIEAPTSTTAAMVDLMAALEASVAQARSARDQPLAGATTRTNRRTTRPARRSAA